MLEREDGDEHPGTVLGTAGSSDAWHGTPLYLSPEAARGEPADASVDLWALAMVLWEALAGRHPYSGEPAHRVILRVYDGVVPHLRTAAPGVPEALAGFLGRALAGDPRSRPRDFEEFERLLRSTL